MNLKANYNIQSDGSICYENESGINEIVICMSLGNTLMIESLSIENLSMENALKGILTAQSHFMSGFVIPQFSSELETKDATGVIERFSNMPGRSIERKAENKLEDSRSLGLGGKILADAAGVASKAALTAAEANGLTELKSD